MKFLLDAHLPPSLVNIFNDKGYFTIHTLNLPNKNESSDNEITEYAIENNFIIITKDTDFYYSYLTRNVPKKNSTHKNRESKHKIIKEINSLFF